MAPYGRKPKNLKNLHLTAKSAMPKSPFEIRPATPTVEKASWGTTSTIDNDLLDYDEINDEINDESTLGGSDSESGSSEDGNGNGHEVGANSQSNTEGVANGDVQAMDIDVEEGAPKQTVSTDPAVRS